MKPKGGFHISQVERYVQCSKKLGRSYFVVNLNLGGL